MLPRTLADYPCFTPRRIQSLVWLGAWVSVPADMVVPYASLIEIPIRGGSFNRTGNSTLTVHAHYQTLSCKHILNATDWLEDGSSRLFYHNHPSSDPQVAPQRMYWNQKHETLIPSLFLDVVNNTGAQEHITNYLYPTIDLEPGSKLELVVAGMCNSDDFDDIYWTFQICDISTSYVDIEFACTRFSPSDELSCRTARVRNNPGFPIAGNLTAVSSGSTMTGIIWELPFATASQNSRDVSRLETYLLDPTFIFKRKSPELPGGVGGACFANVSLDVFGARMATALNTAIMAMYNPSILTGGDGTSLEGRNAMWHNSTATWTEFVESRYVMHKAWFSVSLASTLVLFCLSLVNVVIRCIIKAPDFLEGVAGLTRDSQYIRVIQEGSGMSGSNRLQMIKGTKVRICDVNPDSDVGKIALTTNIDSPKLDWRRTYT